VDFPVFFLRLTFCPAVGGRRSDQPNGQLDGLSPIPKDYKGACVKTGSRDVGMQRDERQENELSRRDFHRLASAAFGGVLAGAIAGCGDGDRAAKQTTKSDVSSTPAASKAGTSTAGSATGAGATLVALHACRGLNECKSQGKDHKNACVGQGNCFTVTHECSEKNDCKNQGGCGGTNGFNECKGKGGCGHFPIEPVATWKKARAAFESRMKEAGKKVGPAPAVAG
jgi:hypothetical protein